MNFKQHFASNKQGVKNLSNYVMWDEDSGCFLVSALDQYDKPYFNFDNEEIFGFYWDGPTHEGIYKGKVTKKEYNDTLKEMGSDLEGVHFCVTLV